MGIESKTIDLQNILGEFVKGMNFHNEFPVWQVIKLDVDNDYVLLRNTVSGKEIERKASNKNLVYRSL